MEFEVTKKIELDINLSEKLNRNQLMIDLGKYMKNIFYVKKDQQSIDELYSFLKTINNESDLRFTEAFIEGYKAITEYCHISFDPIVDYINLKIKSLQGETLDENKEKEL